MRALRLIVAVALVAAAVAAAVVAARPRRGRLAQVTGLDDGRALVVWEAENRAGSTIELVDIDGEVRWSRFLPGVAPNPADQAWTALLGETVQYRGTVMDARPPASDTVSRSPIVLGLDVESGEVRWQRSPFERGDELGYRGLWGSQLADETMVYEVYESLEQWLLVIARDAATGEERWRYRSRRSVTAAGPIWLTAGYLVISDLHFIRIVDADSGVEVRRVPLLGTEPCVVGNDLYTTRDGRLRVLSLDSLEERELDLSAELAEDEDRYLRLHGLCGLRGDLVVLAFDSAVVALDRELGELPWQLDIDEATFADVVAGRDARRRFPRSVPLSGELPRYVPVLMQGDRTVLVMLDLDSGDIAWSSPPELDLTDAHLLRVGDLNLLVRTGRDASIAVFDGATGDLLAARRLGRFVNAPSGLAPHQVIGDRLVLFDGDEWIAVDSRTLALTATPSGAHELEDIQDELASTLWE